jgi:uncharacterized protein YjbJ (UPF0337 family)
VVQPIDEKGRLAMTEIRDGAEAMVRKQAIRLAGLDDKATLLRTVAADQGVRTAVRRAARRAAQLRQEVDTSDARGELSRLARDEKLQAQVAGLLRAVTGVLDAGVVAGKRRARRRVGRFVLAGSAVGVLAYLAARRLRNDPPDQAGSTGSAARNAKETLISTGDKLKHTWDETKGKVGEAAGRATGDRSLEAEGRADQAGASVGKVADNAKDAGHNLEDAAQQTFDK